MASWPQLKLGEDCGRGHGGVPTAPLDVQFQPTGVGEASELEDRRKTSEKLEPYHPKLSRRLELQASLSRCVCLFGLGRVYCFKLASYERFFAGLDSRARCISSCRPIAECCMPPSLQQSTPTVVDTSYNNKEYNYTVSSLAVAAGSTT